MGRPFLRIERDEDAGYRVWADEYGTHLIAPDGTRCASAFPDAPPWRGLRLLAAQAMPLMTALRGREVMHAAGVVVGEHLVGIVAVSGTGKSATAANLMAQGGRFFADDVLPLDLSDGAVIAHPGTRLVNVHARDLEAIEEPGRDRIGVPMGETDKLHLDARGLPACAPSWPRSSSSSVDRTSRRRAWSRLRTSRDGCSAMRSCPISTCPRGSGVSSRSRPRLRRRCRW